MEPEVVRIYSENNEFQYLETLRRNRVKRYRSNEFFVEGVRLIDQALQHGWQFNALVYATDKRLSDWAQRVIATSKAKRLYELPMSLMAKISQKEETSELIAIVGMQRDDLQRIPVRDDLLVVLLDRPSSPGNVGAIIRSCDALGVNGIIISGHAVDLYDPETIRATTGSFFSLPIVRLASPTDITPWLEGLWGQLPGLQVVGTSSKASVPIVTHDFNLPTILLIGNETQGLSQQYRLLCNIMVTIPMTGTASSLNVACATSILLYETIRQRGLIRYQEEK